MSAPLPRPGEGPDAPRFEPTAIRGMGYMLLSCLGSAAMITGIRYLAAELHSFEIAFFRSLFGFAVFLPVFVRYGLAPLATRRPVLMAACGGFNVASMLAHFLGLATVPLAAFSALNFTLPLMVSLLAAVVLGERLRLRRLSAIAIGFAGTLLILRPGAGALDPGALMVILGAAFWAAGVVILKRLAATESSLTITIYLALWSIPVALVAAVPVWRWPTAEEFGWLIGIGVAASINQYAFARALKVAEVTVLAPLEFSKLPLSALFGFALFAEVPDAWTWLGGAVIFAASFYVIYRESRLKRARASEPGPVRSSSHPP